MLDQDNCRVDPLYWILFRRRSRSVEDHFSDSSKITVCQNFFFLKEFLWWERDTSETKNEFYICELKLCFEIVQQPHFEIQERVSTFWKLS